MGITHLKSAVQADFTGTVTGFNSAGATTTLAATDLIRPVDWNSGHGVIQTISSQTGGDTSAISGTNIVYGGTNAVTLRASTAAGGGTIWFDANYAPVVPDWENLNRQSLPLVTNLTATGVTRRLWFFPMDVGVQLSYNHMMLAVSRPAAGQNIFTLFGGIYTISNSTKLNLLGSFQNAYSQTSTAIGSAVKRIRITGMQTAATALTPGRYVFAFACSGTAGTSGFNLSVMGEATANPPTGVLGPGTDAITTANLSSIRLEHWQGLHTTTTGGMPATVHGTDIQYWTTAVKPYLYLGSS